MIIFHNIFNEITIKHVKIVLLTSIKNSLKKYMFWYYILCTDGELLSENPYPVQMSKLLQPLTLLENVKYIDHLIQSIRL